jgi:hypothetical protein
MPVLGEGEAVRSWPVEVWGVPAVHPPASAPGFQSAERLGVLPTPPPAVPPSPVPGLSSWDRLRLALLGFAVFAAMIPLVNALGAGALAALLVAAPFGASTWLLSSTTARDEVEFAAGYTSGGAHTGLWRLHGDGRVLRRPDRSVPPPGWDPPPYYPGLLQRWDGPGWKPLPRRWWRHEHLYFRVPDRPFV